MIISKRRVVRTTERKNIDIATGNVKAQGRRANARNRKKIE